MINKIKITHALALFFIALTMPSCNDTPDVREVVRQSSPNGKVDVVLAENKSGATTGKSEHVYIVPHGDKTLLHEVCVIDKSQSLRVYWQSEKRLIIEYEKARIFKFSNFWNSGKVDDFEYVVEITLDPTSASALP